MVIAGCDRRCFVCSLSTRTTSSASSQLGETWVRLVVVCVELSRTSPLAHIHQVFETWSNCNL